MTIDSDETMFLLLLFLIAACGTGAILAWLGDWLEKHFPYKDTWL